MMNYILMVLRFPTVRRVRANDTVDAFPGNRAMKHLVTWVVSNNSVTPFSDYIEPEQNKDDEYGSTSSNNNEMDIFVVDDDESKPKSERIRNRNRVEE